MNKGRIYQATIADCSVCPLKSRCIKASRRYLSRHAHEVAFVRMELRMQAYPKMMVGRQSIVGPPSAISSNGYLAMVGSCCDN
jgi:hypothetical protein